MNHKLIKKLKAEANLHPIAPLIEREREKLAINRPLCRAERRRARKMGVSHQDYRRQELGLS